MMPNLVNNDPSVHEMMLEPLYKFHSAIALNKPEEVSNTSAKRLCRTLNMHQTPVPYTKNVKDMDVL